MIIKGILKTIDYNNNSCTVRLPLFETTNNSGEVVLPAIFMNQPGMFNGYNEGDIVFVDFENNKLEAPIIIGKLYLGSEKEASNSQKGGLKIASLTVDSSATLPLDTKLVFNHTSSDAPVDKGLSSYKSIIDIIKAIHTTETTLEKVTDTQNSTNDSFIQRIEVTYLSQLAELEAPLSTNEGWSLVIPASRDGYKIWQKTTTYNNKGQILGTPEIICISDLTGTASYWLKCSTKNHAGNQQSPTEAVEITAMIKLGLNIETEDTDATLYYKWSGEEEISANSNKIVLTNNGDFKNKNLIIRAERNGITYLTETILYTPLNTPILRFSKETDSLSYDSYGYNKLNASDTASVTATVLLNNEIIPATYTWILEDCTNIAQRPAEPSWDPIEVSGSSITIYHIAETAEQATATCNAVYTDPAGNQQTLTKVFSISKNRQGKSLYKIDILNEFSTIPLSYDDKYEDANLTFTEHTVSAFYGDDVLTFTVGNTPNTNSDNKSYYLYIKQTSGLTLTKVANQQTSAFTTKVNTITADTGEVIYELYRGNTKVASAKFELSVLRSGTPATNLWLVISHPVHTGSQHSTPITVQPKIQIGNTGIDNNTESYVGYKYESDETYTKLVWNSDRELFEIPLPYRAENIKIIASQNEDLSDSYEEEEITYSPLNTPVIDLTNDSDDLVYTPGGTKIDKDEIATSTASLWLNGEKLDAAQFTWNLVGCKGSSNISADKKDTTVTITELTEAKGTATCVATYKGKTYTKVFSVAKQIQGDASTSYWLKLSTVVHTGTNQERPIEAIAMKKEGTKVESEDSSAKLYFRYFSDTSWSSTATSSCLINNYKNEDLYIVAVHGDYTPDLTTTEASSEIYDWETITYSPLNTPVIDLTNDRGSLTYNDQDKKLISDETTSTTATLYLNGVPVNATYEWTYNAGTEADDTVGYTLSNNNKTITISHINENINKAEATCRATYKGNTYTKVFTIIKNINSVKYWLKTSTKIHTGTTSLDNIEIIAMRKEGTSAETPDTTAHLWYKFKSEQTWRKESDGSTHLININKTDLKDEDLIIAATHNNSNSAPLDVDIYDQETITYSPKNTPVIDLTNDSDILPYDADGFIIGNPLAQTTAELYLNGEKINETNLSFSWVDASNNKNVITFEGETNKPTIKIKAISENTATATCNITIAANGINGQFANKTYSKDFKIVRQIKGDPTTIYKIVPSTATVTYTKANTYIPTNIEFNILESRGIKEPTIIDFETVAGLELITNQDGLEFTKTNSTYSLSSSNIIWPLEVSLIKNNVLIHKETINKVTDGTDGADGQDGQDATSYWLKGVEAVHLGSKQATNINIVAVKQTGLNGTEEDKDAILWWTFDGKDSWESPTSNKHILQFTAGSGYALANNKDITILATHNSDFKPDATTTAADSNIYEWETITYSPLNTPILDLNNDSASLNYTSEGTKIDTADNVSSTATLYLNGEAITTARYIWYLENCITDTAATTNNTHLITDTISINSITANNGTATCLAFKDKDIKAVVIRPGWPEESWIRYSTGTAETWTGSTAINPNEYFVIVGRATDSKKLHIILGQATSSNNGEISGSAVSYDEAFTKVFSISKQLKGDVGDTTSTRVENAFYVTNNYDVTTPNIPGSSTKTSLTVGQWAILSEYPKETVLKDGGYKLVFHSSRTIYWNETTDSMIGTPQAWSLPVMYWCENPEAYRILTTAKGLFGYGQGVYYTPAPQRDETGKIIGDKEITLDDRVTKYKTGQKISQQVAADYVAGSPKDRKDDLELYIDAEYIRTGALKVEKDVNKDGKKETIFEAGLDDGIVKIGGFEVSDTHLTASTVPNTNISYSYKDFKVLYTMTENSDLYGGDGLRAHSCLNEYSKCFGPNSSLPVALLNLPEEIRISLKNSYWVWLSLADTPAINGDILIYETDMSIDLGEGLTTYNKWKLIKLYYNTYTRTYTLDVDSNPNNYFTLTNKIIGPAEVYVGTDKIELTHGPNIVKLQQGILFANNAEISGKIEAESGNIGGFTITDNCLYTIDQTKFDEVADFSTNFNPSGTSTWKKFVNDASVKVTGYRALKSTNQNVDSSGCYLKVVFKQKIPTYPIYIRTDSEPAWDFIIAGRPNTAVTELVDGGADPRFENTRTWPSTNWAGTTRDIDGTLVKETLDDGNSYVKVTYQNIMPNDYIYILYVKDETDMKGTDTGWVLLPNPDTLKTLNKYNLGLGTENSVFISALGLAGTITNQYNEKWNLTIGENFGVSNEGKIVANGGSFTGDISASSCSLDNVRNFNFTGDTFSIGGMTLSNYITKSATTTNKSVNFKIAGGGSSYIGGNTLYVVKITATDPTDSAPCTMAETTTLKDKIKSVTFLNTGNDGYPIYTTIPFNKDITFPKGTKEVTVSAVGGSYGLYGGWKVVEGKFSNDKATIQQDVKVVDADIETSVLQCSGGFVPQQSGQGKLGTENLRWGNIYGKDIDADGTVKFTVNGKKYEPVIRLSEWGSPNCFWACTVSVQPGWTDISSVTTIPDELAENIVSVSLTAKAIYGQTPGSNDKNSSNPINETNFDNRWYVDWLAKGKNIYVYNGLSQEGTACILVAAKI